MGNDGIGRDAQVVGNLLVCHSLDDSDDHVALAVGKGLAIVGILTQHRRDLDADVVALQLLLMATYGGDENVVLHLSMGREPTLTVI